MQKRMRLAFRMAVASTVVLVLSGPAFAQAPGTWKLNLAKSTYSQDPAPKSNTLKYEPAGAAINATVDSVSADGAVIHFEYTSNYDGKDTPVIGNSTDRNMTSRTRINATTTKMVNKKDGRITTNQTFVMSPDGKMLTITTTGTNAAGHPINNIAVYDKQ